MKFFVFGVVCLFNDVNIYVNMQSVHNLYYANLVCINEIRLFILLFMGLFYNFNLVILFLDFHVVRGRAHAFALR